MSSRRKLRFVSFRNVSFNQRSLGSHKAARKTSKCQSVALIQLQSSSQIIYSFFILILKISLKDELHLCNGESFKTAYDTFKSNDQLVAIGINCTNPKYISSLLKSVQREEREKPFIVCPNDGSEWDSQSQCYISKFEKDSFVSLIPEWVDLDAKYIGGCYQINSKK